MIETITEHLFDLLAADSRLVQSGTSWGSAFGGVTREMHGDAPKAGFVNLFDRPFVKDSTEARPAVYMGEEGFELSLEEESPAISSGRRVAYMLLKMILVVVADDPSLYNARKMRNQLLHNVQMILMDHRVETNYWYDLEFQGNRAGGDMRIAGNLSSTGSPIDGNAEGVMRFPVMVRFSLGPATTQA